MGLLPIHMVTIGTMLKFFGGNNGHGLKTLRVHRPLDIRTVPLRGVLLGISEAADSFSLLRN